MPEVFSFPTVGNRDCFNVLSGHRDWRQVLSIHFRVPQLMTCGPKGFCAIQSEQTTWSFYCNVSRRGTRSRIMDLPVSRASPYARPVCLTNLNLTVLQLRCFLVLPISSIIGLCVVSTPTFDFTLADRLYIFRLRVLAFVQPVGFVPFPYGCAHKICSFSRS